MNDVEKVKTGINYDADGWSALGALERIETALRTLTAEHGSQCRCQGCEVLREVA